MTRVPLQGVQCKVYSAAREYSAGFQLKYSVEGPILMIDQKKIPLICMFASLCCPLCWFVCEGS